MQELQAAAMTLGWPVVIALAGALGDFGHRTFPAWIASIR